MPQKCCVFGCEHFDILHRFPKPGDISSEADRIQQWKAIVGQPLEGKTDDDIYFNYRICNHHFEDRFLYHASKRLARTAYPTLNLDVFSSHNSYETNVQIEKSVTSSTESVVDSTQEEYSRTQRHKQIITESPVSSRDSYETNIQVDNEGVQSVTSTIPSMVESTQREYFKSQSWKQIINDSPVIVQDSYETNSQSDNEDIQSVTSISPSVVESIREECSKSQRWKKIITDAPVSIHDSSATNFPIERVYIQSGASSCPSVVGCIHEVCSETQSGRQIITSKPVGRQHHTDSKIIKRLTQKIVVLKNKLTEQRRKVALAKKMSRKKLFANVLKHLPVPTQILLNMQLKQCNKKSRGRRFNFEEISLSMSLFEKSPQGYKLLRNMLALPSVRTLQGALKKNTTVKP